MSVSLGKNGVVSASGEIGANILCGSYITLTQTTDGSSNASYTIPDTSMITAGTKLVTSVDIELYNVESMSRIGCEPSFTIDGSTRYFGVWTTDITDRKQRIYNTWTATGSPTAVGQHGIYIQKVVFKAGGGYIKVSNPKFEVGTVPTDWCPNINDDYYVGNTSGFNEQSNIAQITKGYINAPDFMEI
jgi:hypothetical protein